MRRVCLVMVLLALAGTAHAQPISASDALAQAARTNATLRAAMLDVIAAQAGTRAAEDARRAIFTASATGQQAERFGGTAAGAVRNTDQSVQIAAGADYTTVLGTVLSLDLTTQTLWRQTNRDPSTTMSFNIGPNYIGQATLTARQPLLRGAGSEVTLAPEVAARSDVIATEQDRDRIASETARDVLIAYWELWYAERAIEVQRLALQVAQRQHEEARIRYEQLGASPRVDVLRFETEVTAIREALLTAESTRDERALALAVLLGTNAATATDIEVVTAAPELDEVPPLGAMLRASHDTAEVAALEARVHSAEVRLIVLDDATRPRLDLIGTFGAAVLYAEDTLPGLQLPGGRPALTGLIGLEFELPTGSTRQDAELARGRAELEAAQIRRDASVQSIEIQVATLHRRASTAQTRTSLAADTARVQAELAEAERQRLELGTSTAYEVVRAQQDAREAELRRLRALVDAASSSFELEHRTGALLARLGPRMLGGQP